MEILCTKILNYNKFKVPVQPTSPFEHLRWRNKFLLLIYSTNWSSSMLGKWIWTNTLIWTHKDDKFGNGVQRTSLQLIYNKLSLSYMWTIQILWACVYYLWLGTTKRESSSLPQVMFCIRLALVKSRVLRPSMWPLICSRWPLAGQLCWFSAIINVLSANELDPQITGSVITAMKVVKNLFAFSWLGFFMKISSLLIF